MRNIHNRLDIFEVKLRRIEMENGVLVALILAQFGVKIVPILISFIF